MIQMIWPVLIIILASTFYNICAKATPGGVQPFASLTVTYLVAAAASVVLFFVTNKNKNLFAAVAQTNWTAVIFGFCIVALEFGYLYIYRVGWKISTGSLVANVALACVLLLIGSLLYKEAISIKQIFGFALCILGIILISK